MVSDDKFGSMVKLCGKEPRSFFISTCISSPADKIEELAVTPSPINLRVKDFFDFIFNFSVDLDRRRRRLNSIWNGAWVGKFELGDVEDGMHGFHSVGESECEGMSTWCHDRDTQSTLYHSIQLHPRVYRPFHCMYLRSLIISIVLVLLLIGERFVQSVFLYNYLICFHLQSRLLSVPVPLYLLIRYTSGNRPQTSLGLLIALCELHWSSACLTPRASPHTFYSSI